MLVAKVYEYFSVMVSENDCKYCNMTEPYKTVFQSFQDYFTILHNACFLYYFRAALKGWRIQFNNVFRNKEEKY